MSVSFENPLQAQKQVWEQAVDPQVSLGDLIKNSGFEGLQAEERLQLIELATLDDYISVVDIVHRKLAPDVSPDPKPTAVEIEDRTTHEVVGVAAQPSERLDVLEHALTNAKAVVQKYRTEGGSIKDTLGRAGNLAAFGIVLAHTYSNGNGRTARAVGMFVKDGFDSTDTEAMEDFAVLSQERSGSGTEVYQYTPIGDWDQTANQKPLDFLDVVAALDVPLDDASYKQVKASAFRTLERFTAPVAS